MAPYTQSNRPDLDARYIFDLKIAQERGLKFGKTGSFAIILKNTMPTGALAKMVKFNRNNSETEILFDKRPSQVTEVTRTRDPIQPYIESARRDTMHSYVETARTHPLRDNCGRAQSSHIDFRIQGEPEQSPHNEDQENNSLRKLLVKQVLEVSKQKSKDGGTIHKGVPRDVRGLSYCWKNTAISKLMKCSWSQTLYNARHPAIVKHLNTHIAHEDKPIHEQVTKSRYKFFNTSWIVSKHSRRTHLCLQLGDPEG